MKILESLKRTMESIESKKAHKVEAEDEFVDIRKKYTDVPAEVLESIISDVKEACGKKFEENEEPQEIENANDAEQVTEEDLNKVEIKPAEGKPVDEPNKTDTLDAMNELDASEDDDTASQTPSYFYTEDDEEEIDDLLMMKLQQSQKMMLRMILMFIKMN